MQGKSFFEVLEDQLRKDLRAEIEAEIRAQMSKNDDAQERHQAFRAEAASGQVESWLASHLGKTIFSRSQDARKAYGRPRKPSANANFREEKPVLATNPQPQPEFVEPRISLKTAEDLIALEFLKRHSGVALASTLTHKELKTAWRKAALKTHPDRFVSEDAVTQARMKAAFQGICMAFERLEKRFEAESQAA